MQQQQEQDFGGNTPKPMACSTNKLLKIRGIPVDFCYTPYGAQITMMDQALKAITKQANCLIESPTGSGKTLALLSSTLAWQRLEEARIRELRLERQEVLRQELEQQQQQALKCEAGAAGSCPLHPSASSPYLDDTLANAFALNTSDDFVCGVVPSCECSCSTAEPLSPAFTNRMANAVSEDDSPPVITIEDNDGKEKDNIPEKFPKIFYGTRTHKQVAHIISELNKTKYADIKYTILGSREQSCIHPVVSTKADKTSQCHELLAPGGVGCTFQVQLKKNYDRPSRLRKELTATALRAHGIDRLAWDIEDLVTVSKQMRPKGTRFCPYFASTRVLLNDAQLIICPYNYLIDPLIRQSLKLNLADHVVVLDEAHNIEDVCREGASFTFHLKELEAAAWNFRDLSEKYSSPEVIRDRDPESVQDVRELVVALEELHELMFAVVRWLRALIRTPNMKEQPGVRGDATSVGLWEGVDAAASLRTQHHPPAHNKDQLDVLAGYLKTMAGEDFWSQIQQQNENADKKETDATKELPRPAAASLQQVEAWMQQMTYFTDNEPKFKLCVSTAATREPLPNYDHQAPISRFANGFTLTQQHQAAAGTRDFDVKAEFWCMDPSIAFSNAVSETRSVLLASGTLCPTETFRTELGVPFDNSMEGAHVVNKDNVFVAALGVGPEDVSLRGTYSETQTAAFRDELGRVLWHVCSAMPGGVLCFFPSYRLMQQLTEHWQQSRIWNDIAGTKVIVEEPRDGRELDAVLDTYSRAIQAPGSYGTACTGALMLAICRGKVSEGTDFPDDLARAVITVGIPYPNVRDLQVEHKRQWNDRMKMSDKNRTILSGKRWYEIQAFRAINQALGRCIRHKNDWGALVLVDERFVEGGGRGAAANNPYVGGVSRWIRQGLRPYPAFTPFIRDLNEFAARKRQQQTTQAAPATAAPSTPLACMNLSTPRGRGAGGRRANAKRPHNINWHDRANSAKKLSADIL